MFRGWQRQLGEGWETRRVRLAGREARFHDPYPRSIEEAVEELLPELGALVGGQLVLFGHSMGGLLAYEACCQLERAGRPVDGLVVAATAAPVGPAPWREGQERFEEIAPTGDDDQGTDEMRALMRSTLRRDVALCLRYTERTQRVAAPLLVLQGSHDPFVSDASSARWRALAAGEVGFRTFEGGHHFVLDRSREIAALLRGVGRLPVAAGEQDR